MSLNEHPNEYEEQILKLKRQLTSKGVFWLFIVIMILILMYRTDDDIRSFDNQLFNLKADFNELQTNFKESNFRVILYLFSYDYVY